MKKTVFLLGVLGLTGCQTTVHHVSGGQAIGIDANKTLLVWVEGVKTRPATAEFTEVRNPGKGEPIHRTLQNTDGAVLFAYDLQVNALQGNGASGGAYRILLKPSKETPTFAASREVTVASHDDVVRVELMEQPATGQKIVDAFRLTDRQSTRVAEIMSPAAHLRRAHQMLFNLLHGE